MTFEPARAINMRTLAMTPMNNSKRDRKIMANENKPFTSEDVEKRFYDCDSETGQVENLTDANDYIKKICALEGLEIKSNLKMENGSFAEPLPELFGLLIHPVKERAETKGEKPVLKAVAITAVPSLALLAGNTENGLPFLRDAVVAKYEQKINSSIKPRSDGTLPPADSIPRSFEDFVTNRREVLSYGAYSELAPNYVKVLKKFGLNWVNPVVLRQALQSKDYASQFAVKEGTFEGVLDMMIADAKKKNLDASIMENWKSTRDEAKIVEEAPDVDMEEMAKLLAA